MASSSARERPRNLALILVAGCLVTSGLIRSALIAPVFAEAGDGLPAAEMAMEAEPDYDGLLKAIREREAQLDARQSQIDERLALLELAEKEFDRKRAELLAAEEALAQTIAQAEEASERDIAQITAIYENVKAKRAAEIFESMDSTFAAGVLARMTPQSAADILTAMDAGKAYEISVILAARNLDAGRPSAAD